MSTFSNICIENQDGTIDFIYCHSDSYPQYVGLVLYTFYNTEEKVRKLISLGDLSSLGIRIGKKISSDKIAYLNRTPEDELNCVAYARDRGERKHISHCKDRETYFKEIGYDFPFSYVFKGGIWYIKWPSLNRMHKLKTVLEEEWVQKGKRNQNLRFHIFDEFLTKEEKIRLYKVYEELRVLKTYLKKGE